MTTRTYRVTSTVIVDIPDPEELVSDGLATDEDDAFRSAVEGLYSEEEIEEYEIDITSKFESSSEL